jgi:hypothetical protein
LNRFHIQSPFRVGSESVQSQFGVW